jgi:hypothetical protein
MPPPAFFDLRALIHSVADGYSARLELVHRARRRQQIKGFYVAVFPMLGVKAAGQAVRREEDVRKPDGRAAVIWSLAAASAAAEILGQKLHWTAGRSRSSV